MRGAIKLTTAILTTALLIITVNSQARANLTMTIEPSSATVGPNQQFDMELVLNNLDNLSFDTLQLWIIFDPTYLQVKDTDDGNWIIAGTNILDTPYHTTFPFNFHMDNSADNLLGEIVYNEGVLGTTINSSGTFAKITFLTLDKLTSQTTVSFQKDVLKDTAVLRGGENILDGFSGANVSVVPEPCSFVLVGTGLLGLLRLVKRKV